MREETYGEILGDIPGLGDFDLESVERLADRAEKSAKAYAEVAKKSPSPVDQRLADALVDLARAVDALKAAAEDDRARLDGVEKTLGSIDEAAKSIEATGSAIRTEVGDAVDAALFKNAASFELVEEAADGAMAALDDLNGKAEAKYAAAVDESCRRLAKATWLAVAAILAAATAGVAAAAFGAFWLTSANPAIQRFVADNGVFALISVIAVLFFLVFFVWCYATRKK